MWMRRFSACLNHPAPANGLSDLGASISGLDHGVGAMLKGIADLQLEKHTVVMVSLRQWTHGRGGTLQWAILRLQGEFARRRAALALLCPMAGHDRTRD